MDFLCQPSTSLPPALPEMLWSERAAGGWDAWGGHRDLQVASSLTLTVPMIFPSCQLLIIPLIKVALQGNRSFVAQELICSCCSFPALNRNPQMGTLQLATVELGTVSPRIRAPFGGELGDPALAWVDGSLQDGVSPLQPPKEGDELKSPPEPGILQPTSSGHPLPGTLSASGLFLGCMGPTQPLCQTPWSPPCRQTQAGLPTGRVALYSVTLGTKVGLGGPTGASTHTSARL